MKVRVRDFDKLLRDSSSRAIVNTDEANYAKRLAKIRRDKKRLEETTALENRIAELESVIQHILKTQDHE